MLKIERLSKNFGRKEVLKDISYQFQKGVYGLLGPNGAGKSTTMNMITGYIEPTEGEIIINGYDMNKDFVHAIEKVGATIENACFYSYLKE